MRIEPRRERRDGLDDLDRRIVTILQKDGRTPNREIARSLGVSEATIRNRIARMLDEDLINIVAVPTPKAVGMSMSAIIGVSVDLAFLDEVATTISGYGEVRYVGVATGPSDIILEAFFEDQEQLLTFLSQRLGRLQGVTKVATSVILKVTKFSYEWELGLVD